MAYAHGFPSGPGGPAGPCRPGPGPGRPGAGPAVGAFLVKNLNRGATESGQSAAGILGPGRCAAQPSLPSTCRLRQSRPRAIPEIASLPDARRPDAEGFNMLAVCSVARRYQSPVVVTLGLLLTMNFRQLLNLNSRIGRMTGGTATGTHRLTNGRTADNQATRRTIKKLSLGLLRLP